jgi:hypothetical protein
MLLRNLENAVIGQVGGAKKGSGTDMLMVLGVGLLFLSIKAYLVMATYNSVAPRIIENNGGSLNNFRELSFGEGVLLVILANNLFQ